MSLRRWSVTLLAAFVALLTIAPLEAQLGERVTRRDREKQR